MVRYHDTLWCDGCGIEIIGAPFVKGKASYCCQDCSLGLQCDCGDRLELDEERDPTGSPSDPGEGS